MYKFYSKKIEHNNNLDKRPIHESSNIIDTNDIIRIYELTSKSGKEIQLFLNKNGIKFEKLLKLSTIYNDWYLYSCD
jgi:hypothetical protein